MSFGSFQSKSGQIGKPMSDINVTPMVDVMLVLLVIFIITTPLLTHAIKLELPNVQSGAAPDKPQSIRLSLDAQDHLYWDATPITLEEAEQRFALAAHAPVLPDLQLRADKTTHYEAIAAVMAAAQAQGLSKIGFVTEARPKNPQILKK